MKNSEKIEKAIQNMLQSECLTDFFENMKTALKLMKDQTADESTLDSQCKDLVQRIFDEAKSRELTEEDRSEDVVIFEKNDAVLFAVASYICTSELDQRVSFRELYGFQKFMLDRIKRKSKDSPITREFVEDVLKEVQKNFNYLKAVSNDTFSVVLLDDEIGDFTGAFYDDRDYLARWYLIFGSDCLKDGLDNADVFFSNLGVVLAKQIANLEGCQILLNNFIVNMSERNDISDIISAAADYIGVGLRYNTKYVMKIDYINKYTNDTTDYSYELHQKTKALIEKLIGMKSNKLC